ncbi:MAG: hypothetical protein R3C41_04630 [Calditrichia bacterium]|nr:hypothetical protein [Calditrichota bacterium]MCB0268648.1 hypothetical protein [Calditrichota bacterium]MCB9069710.1 hypothetical protein [Calditrichia bacterium]
MPHFRFLQRFCGYPVISRIALVSVPLILSLRRPEFIDGAKDSATTFYPLSFILYPFSSFFINFRADRMKTGESNEQ